VDAEFPSIAASQSLLCWSKVIDDVHHFRD